jgi:hypothetical protein
LVPLLPLFAEYRIVFNRSKIYNFYLIRHLSTHKWLTYIYNKYIQSTLYSYGVTGYMYKCGLWFLPLYIFLIYCWTYYHPEYIGNNCPCQQLTLYLWKYMWSFKLKRTLIGDFLTGG